VIEMLDPPIRVETTHHVATGQVACNSVASRLVGSCTPPILHTGGTSIGSFINTLLTKRFRVPNTEFLTGPVNVVVGNGQVLAGIAAITGGTGADATVFGIPLGIPAQTYGVVQVASGLHRVYSGVRQSIQAIAHPMITGTVPQLGERVFQETAPFGGQFNSGSAAAMGIDAVSDAIPHIVNYIQQQNPIPQLRMQFEGFALW
jgi:hypothetical protein